MATKHTLTGYLPDLVGADIKGAMVRVGTNLGDKALVDLTADPPATIMPGVARISLDGASFSVELIDTDSTGLNVEAGTLRHIIYIDYSDGRNGKRTWSSPFFSLTADADLASKIADEYLDPTFAGAAIAEVQALVDEAAVIRDETSEISGLTGEDEAVALLMDDEDSLVSQAQNRNFVAEGSAFADLGKQVGVDPTGTIECAAAIQAALDSCAAFGLRAYAKGAFLVGSTITITSSADLGDATFNYTGTGTAVQIGAGPNLLRRTVVTPRVFEANKTGAGWAAGTIGVRLLNAYSCFVTIPHVKGFETGIEGAGVGSGCVYNEVSVGHLENNKRNMLLTADATGWVNQNTFIGGRYAHLSSEGATVSGSAHILMDVTPNGVNNNYWLNPSLEGNVAEFQAVIAGGYNVIDNARWEGGNGIKWAANSTLNEIRGGYQASTLTEARESGAQRNRITSGNRDRYTFTGAAPLAASGSLGGLVLENTSSSANPSWSIMEAGAWAAGTLTPPGYAWAASAQKIRGKRAADLFDRLWFDAVNGRVYFGNGTADPTAYIGNFGGTSLTVSGNLNWVADNTQDVGGAANRPRYIRAGTALVTAAVASTSRPSASTAGAGASIFDSTLGKPIWSNGTAWVDAAGVVV